MLLRMLMTLHLLPHEKIPKLFTDLKVQSEEIDVEPDEATMLRKLFDYVEKIGSLRICGRRKNGQCLYSRLEYDAKGWHNRINRRAGKGGVNMCLYSFNCYMQNGLNFE